MSKCIVTGKIRQIGHNRSHANNATKRPFDSNIQTKRYTLPNGKVVRVHISTKGIRILDKRGVEHLAQILQEKDNG